MFPRRWDFRPSMEVATAAALVVVVVVVDGTSPDYPPRIAWTAQTNNNHCIPLLLELAAGLARQRPMLALAVAAVRIINNNNNLV
jgi:hypothetical protein